MIPSDAIVRQAANEAYLIVAQQGKQRIALGSNCCKPSFHDLLYKSMSALHVRICPLVYVNKQ